jgi:hypothetical protein
MPLILMYFFKMRLVQIFIDCRVWIDRIKAILIMRLRWWVRKRPMISVTGNLPGSYGLERCDVVFINLDSRPDRRCEIEQELLRLGILKYSRFVAKRAYPGILGCGLSHKELLTSRNGSSEKILMILEDDCNFLVSRDSLDSLVEEFALNESLEVLCIAQNSPWSIPISENLAVSSSILTTACYVVKPSAVEALIEAFSSSVNRLLNGDPTHLAALDVVWQSVQQKKFFAVPRRRTAIQRPGFSDIEQSWVDYKV